MNDNKTFNNWQEVIVDFFERHVSESKLFKARDYIKEKEIKIQKETEQKNIKKIREDIENKQKELERLKKEAPQTEIRKWIEESHSKNIEAGSRIIKATHVLKFTHSSAESGGLLLEEKSDDLLVSTASLKTPLILDIAHNNGALITISRFLSLRLLDKLIIDLILEKDFSFLEPFGKNQKQLSKWQIGFANLVEQREMKTVDKAKQLYFPLVDLQTYHLVTPLFASSLCNQIYKVITDIKYGEKQKEINKRRKNKKDNKEMPQYHQSLYVNHPNLAVQNFGGDHPKNVSMLNADRSGKVYLFSCQPPIWQTKLKPPINKKSIFDYYSGTQHIKENIDYLSNFLDRSTNHNLSIKDPKRKKHLDRWVESIIDKWLDYVSLIQALPAGWSIDSKLKEAHQLLLDPYRQDEGFQVKRNTNDWQRIICNDFVRWLNRRLQNKDKKFTPQNEHNKIWRDLISNSLRKHSEMIDLNNNNKSNK